MHMLAEKKAIKINLVFKCQDIKYRILMLLILVTSTPLVVVLGLKEDIEHTNYFY